MIDDQLKWITSLLSSYNITYWIDSGTLLGIIREGSLLNGDKDIDISMWADDFNKVNSILSKKKKYRILISCYKKHFFKIKLFEKKYKYAIDINFFRKKGNYSWCPQARFKCKQNPKNLMLKCSSNIIFRLKKIWPYPIDYNYTLWKHYHILGVWWIPNKYFDNLTNTVGNFTIPQNYQDYLTYRYGNWKVKNSNWNFWLDDNGIKHNIFDFVKDI